MAFVEAWLLAQLARGGSRLETGTRECDCDCTEEEEGCNWYRKNMLPPS